MRAAPVACALVLAQAAALAAGQPLRGRIVERVACAGDHTQTYTVYLPPGYVPPAAGSRRWPVLFIFDPGGRGTEAARIFVDAAEELGWILASSDNTRSGEPDTNARAVGAMWPDVRSRFAVDPRRIYAAGFSAGAGLAWGLAAGSGELAGIIGAGGQFKRERMRQGGRFAVFASAGLDDFNYLQMRDLHAEMVRQRRPTRFEAFEGEHEWMPPVLARDAVGWLEVLAMKDGRRPPDRQLVGTLLEGELGRAAALEAAGDVTGAARRYASVVDAYGGLADVGAARAAHDRLSASRAAKDAERADRQWLEWERIEVRRVARVFVELSTREPGTTPAAAAQEFRLADLQARAKRPALEGHAARRVINWVFIQASWLVWEEVQAKGNLGTALLLQHVAIAIAPDSPGAHVRLAITYARGSQRQAAIGALRRAVDLGFADADRLERDPDLATLKDAPEFQELIARMRHPAEAASSRPMADAGGRQRGAPATGGRTSADRPASPEAPA